MENCMEDPKQWKLELPYDPYIPLLVIFPKEVKTASWRHVCTSTFFAALFTIAKRRKQPKSLSTDEWTMECYLAMRKKEILPFSVTWMETWRHGWKHEGFMLSEISQTEKDKYYTLSLLCGIFRKQTHRNRVEWCCQRLEGRRNRETLVKRYKLLVKRWISFKDLMYYCMVIIVHNTVLYTWNLLRE